MAKSARASVVKKNRQNLKKNVFGPAETARNERLSARLLEIASQPKPPRSEMEIGGAKDSAAKEDKATEADIDMDATTKPTAARSNRSYQRQKEAKAARVQKTRHRKAKNNIVFAKHPMKGKGGKKR